MGLTVNPAAMAMNPILVLGKIKISRRGRPFKAQTGFSLIELLVVMVLIGVAVSVTALALPMQSREPIREDAQILAQLMQRATQTSQAGGRNIVLELRPDGYSFLSREVASTQPSTEDSTLRARRFESASVTFSLEGQVTSYPTLRISMGREFVTEPFVLRLSSSGKSIDIHADGLGNFDVR